MTKKEHVCHMTGFGASLDDNCEACSEEAAERRRPKTIEAWIVQSWVDRLLKKQEAGPLSYDEALMLRDMEDVLSGRGRSSS